MSLTWCGCVGTAGGSSADKRYHLREPASVAAARQPNMNSADVALATNTNDQCGTAPLRNAQMTARR